MNNGERVGLIGPNGSGKSTLLRIITGQEKPDAGHVSLTPPDLRVGYLAQGFAPDPNISLRDYIHSTVGDVEQLGDELAQIASEMESRPNDATLQAAYDETLTKLNNADSIKLQTFLSTFNLHNIDDNLPLHALSGGQKTRLTLALILLQEPNLLILDEPTNHLDIGMLEWLEAWLNGFRGGVLIVSHDRTFLDETINRILDLDPNTQTVKAYPGNYTDYLEQYLKEHEKQWQAYRDQEYEIRRMKQDIARTREQANSVERSTTPRQPNVRRLAKKVMKKAKSREKKLDRYLASEDRVEKPKRSWQMKLDLEDAQHLGKDVLTFENLAIGYDNTPLLTNINQIVQSGDRIIITGENGAGKTTLIRTVVGELEPISGKVRLGASVKLGYMSQEQELLEPSKTALQMLQQTAPFNETDGRSFLHYFLFTGDDPIRPCADLSFGERARLSLALLVAQGCNLLILDEPINHLDIPSRTKFEEALTHFEGTIIAVVHDRYFIEQFATKLWVVVDGEIDFLLI